MACGIANAQSFIVAQNRTKGNKNQLGLAALLPHSGSRRRPLADTRLPLCHPTRKQARMLARPAINIAAMPQLIFLDRLHDAPLAEKEMRHIFRKIELGLATPAEILDRRAGAFLEIHLDHARQLLVSERVRAARSAPQQGIATGSQSQISYPFTPPSILALGGVGRLAPSDPTEVRMERFLMRRERSSWPKEMRSASSSKAFVDPLVLSMLRRVPARDALNVLNRLLLRAVSTHEASLASAALSLGADPLAFAPSFIAENTEAPCPTNLLGALLLRPRGSFARSLPIHAHSRHDDSLLLGSVLLATSLVSATDLPALMALRPNAAVENNFSCLDAFGEAMRNTWPYCAEALAALMPDIGTSLSELNKSGWSLAEGAKEIPPHRLPMLERAYAIAESRAIGDSATSSPAHPERRSKPRI